MEINLMFNNSDNNVLGKSLTTTYSTSCTLKAPTSILNPTILISGNIDITNVNYCYIPQFKRYYYVSDPVSVRDDLWQFKCHVDVLESYKSKLLQLSALIKRSASNGNLTIDDGYTVSSIPLQSEVIWPHGFEEQTNSFILTVLGAPGVTTSTSDESTEEREISE